MSSAAPARAFKKTMMRSSADKLTEKLDPPQFKFLFWESFFLLGVGGTQDTEIWLQSQQHK
jgi:hypothetical protein